MENSWTELRHRIIAAIAPGMAAQHATESQVTTVYCTVLGQRLRRIVRTGWRKSALRAKPGAQCQLINPDHVDKRPRQNRHQRELSVDWFERACTRLNALSITLCIEPPETISVASTLCVNEINISTRSARISCRRKDSLTQRLNWFRSTADLRSRFGTEIAMRACAIEPH